MILPGEWEELELYCDGELRGRALVGEGCPQREVRVSMEKREDGIYRAYIVGERGELPLGVLAPEGQRLTLCRRFYSRDIETLGALLRCEARRSRSFSGEEPWERVSQEKARQISPYLREIGTIWRKSSGKCILAALPWEREKPFPLPGLFCLARVGQVEGHRVVIYTFDRKGCPQMPQERGS